MGSHTFIPASLPLSNRWQSFLLGLPSAASCLLNLIHNISMLSHRESNQDWWRSRVWQRLVVFFLPQNPGQDLKNHYECSQWSQHNKQGYTMICNLPTEWPYKKSVYTYTHTQSLDWLPHYIKATQPVWEIFKIARYILDSLHKRIYFNTKKILA